VSAKAKDRVRHATQLAWCSKVAVGAGRGIVGRQLGWPSSALAQFETWHCGLPRRDVVKWLISTYLSPIDK